MTRALRRLLRALATALAWGGLFCVLLAAGAMAVV